ncbi:MAG: GDSL-type esterase/lipase family protein [Spirochaetota bacterium]
MLEHFKNRIDEKAQKTSSAPVLICALGDSVTQGCMQAGVIDHENVYHDQLKRLLEAAHPATTFSVINAGVGGETAAQGLFRLDRDVFRHSPDLVIIGFCLNDCGGGKDGIARYRQHMNGIISGIREKTAADIVVLTPNFMASRDNPNIADVHRGKTMENIIARQIDGTLAHYVAELRDIARKNDAPLADVYAEWEAMEKCGEDATARLCNGLNHPDAAGHSLIARTIMQLIQPSG